MESEKAYLPDSKRMSGREALWQQASKRCVGDYGIETQYSREHSMDCEYSGDWDCEKCWASEAIMNFGK